MSPVRNSSPTRLVLYIDAAGGHGRAGTESARRDGLGVVPRPARYLAGCTPPPQCTPEVFRSGRTGDRETMVGTLRQALTTFGVWALLVGTAEATCSVTTNTCADGQYCKYGSFMNSCESCPSHCKACGSKTTQQSSRGTCTECTSGEWTGDTCATQRYRVCTGACCENRQFADEEGKVLPERHLITSGTTWVTSTRGDVTCGPQQVLCTSGGLGTVQCKDCVCWTTVPQHCPTGYPDGYPACGGPECSGPDFDGPDNYRGTANGRASCCVGQFLSIHNADVRCKAPQYMGGARGGGYCPNHFVGPPPPPPADCDGSWRSCGSDCKRSWSQYTPQVGTGAACPTDPGPPCKYGEGSCAPPRVDCDGSWTSCGSDCTRTWAQTVAPASHGTACPTHDPSRFSNPCKVGEGACAPDCGEHGTLAAGGKACECSADYYTVLDRSSSPSRSQMAEVTCAIHCQSSIHCGGHGRCDGERMAGLQLQASKDHPVCTCDDGWGSSSFSSFFVYNKEEELEEVLDCTQRDSECTDGATHITVSVVLTTLVLLFPLCCCGIGQRSMLPIHAKAAARGLPRPMLNNWDGVLIDLSSRKNWTRPCVLLLPVTAGFITASAVLLNGEALEYTWDDCAVEAAMIALLCVVMPTAAGLWMISRSANGCLPPKGDASGTRMRDSLVIGRAESFMNLGQNSRNAPLLSHQPMIASDVTADGWYTHVVNADPEGRPVAYCRTPRMDDRTRFSATPGTRLRVVSAVPEWVQCSNQLWLVSKHSRV